MDDLSPLTGGADDPAGFESVARALRTTLVREIDPAVADGHVQLMIAAHHAARGRRLVRRRVGTVGHRARWSAVAAAAAAAAVVAAAMAGALPPPVQARLADAAAAMGVTLPGRGDRPSTRISTPLPPVETTAAPSTTVTTPPTTATQPTTNTLTTAGPTTLVATTAAPSTAAPTTVPHRPTESVPVTVTPTTETAPSTTTPTTRAPTGCIDPALVSATARLLGDGRTVAVVIQTTGTVPYMSATIAGMTGVVANLQPTATGFEGTLTAPAAVPAGSLVEFGSCSNAIRGSIPILG